MRKRANFTLVYAAIALGAVTPTIASAEGLRNEVNNDTSVAQASLFFPPVSDRQAIMVLGQGQVTLPADTARVEFVFSNIPCQESPSSPSDTPSVTLQQKQDSSSECEPTETQLTKETLKPIVDALVGIGVANNNIEIIIPVSSSAVFGDSAANGKIVVNLEKPTRDRVQQIVKLVRETTDKNDKIIIQGTNVRYAVKDCQALVRSAYQAAAKDARNRAEAIAQAMNVELGKAPSVADSFLYDLFVPLCSEASLPSFLPFGSTSTPYNPDAPAEVQLRRDIFVTFPIKR